MLIYVAYKWWERRRFYKILRLARITVEELRGLIDSGKAPAIVDVRTGRSFAAQHIPGALRMTLEELGEQLAALPLDDWMDVTVTPLEPHPNDPVGPRGRGAQISVR